jgi:hypothetical protein
MRANGFVQLDAADPRCLDIRQLENEAYCYVVAP